MKEAIIRPTEAIKPLDKKTVVVDNTISDERFTYLIREVYAIMLDYSRIRRKVLNKNNPIRIGNVSFWFEPEPSTNQPQLKFNNSVKAWDETAIVRDIDQYMHDLYFNIVY